MAEYDLTHVVSKYLDRHLVIPLLEFLQEKKVSGPNAARCYLDSTPPSHIQAHNFSSITIVKHYD